MLTISLFLLAQAAASPEPSAAPAGAANPDSKVVCKSIKITGSRLQTKRICGTKRQWELMSREAEEHVRESQSQSSLRKE